MLEKNMKKKKKDLEETIGLAGMTDLGDDLGFGR